MLKMATLWALIAFITIALSYTVMNPRAAKAPQDFSLTRVQIEIENRYDKVDHISPADFTALEKADVLLIDTRPQEEYSVSHIRGAVQIDPEMTAEDFARLYSERAAGKTLVFYCSVGMRSSNLAARILEASPDEVQAEAIYNLRGGIFAWHNQGRPLVNTQGDTDLIHPYDKNWGQLLTRQETLSFE